MCFQLKNVKFINPINTTIIICRNYMQETLKKIQEIILGIKEKSEFNDSLWRI